MHSCSYSELQLITCDSRFLLAQLHLDLLASYEEKALIHSALTHLPESLVEVYAEIMKRILSKHPNSRKIIYWALFCRKPLTVAELKYATMEEKQEEESDIDLGSFENQLLNETCGLLTIDAVTGTVDLVHKTAKDALERMSAASTVFATAHKEIAERCLTLISADEVVDDCYKKREETSRRWSDTLLLDYAASNWGYHARYATEEEQTIQVLITTFLNKISWRRPSVNVGTVAPYTFPEDLKIGQYPTDWTPLHYLAYFDIICRSKRLLEQKTQKTNVNSNDNFLAVTPLHCAVYQGNEAMVQLLLENDADINAQTNSGDTALHLATIKGHRKIMKILLAKGTDKTKTNEVGNMVLHAAVGTVDDEATVPLLVKSNVDVNAVNSVTGDTGLHLAVQSKRPRILLYLLNKKATVDSFNKRGMTPLHLAAKLNNCEALPLLLERGAAVESRSQDGVTALHVAAQADNWIAFDLLLAAGADINAWDANGDTLLHTRANKRRDTAIISKLIDQGANLEARNSKGYTPLQAAALNGNKEMFFLLLDRGANITVETPRGESLLHITPPNNEDYLEIHQTLLERGLSVDALSSEGWKPIHQAAFRGTGSPDVTLDKSREHLKLLISYGADINSVTQANERETPLHLAARASIPRPSYILLLLSHGADVNAKNGDGKTALHLAAARGRESVFRILLEHGADPSIKAPDLQEDTQLETQSINSKPSIGEETGITAFDLAKKNPLGALWFDEKGELRPMTPQSRRTSTATLIESDIEEEDDDDSETATGATTVTGGSSVISDE
jgi:ankyrin repeat protein